MMLWAFAQLGDGLSKVVRLLDCLEHPGAVEGAGTVPLGSLALAGPFAACEHLGEGGREGLEIRLLGCLAKSGSGLLAPVVEAVLAMRQARA